MGLPAGFDPVKGTFSGVSAPKIQSNYNTISSGSYAGSYYTYSSRNYNLWDRFNDAIKSVGNWIDDIIEPVSGWITILGIIIGAIGLICWIFDDSNILYIILRFIGACFIGGIMFYVVAINAFIISLILKVVRFVFWNAWTFLIALMLGIGVWTYSAYSSPFYAYSPTQQQTEVYTPTYDKYRCAAAALNVRIHPNKTSRVLGTLRKGQEVEVIDKENGFAAIEYNGQRGYASLKYLTKIN